jgi:hypothetical protein
VRDREAVVDVEVEAVDEAIDEGLGIVGLFAGVEAEILHDLHAGDELAQALLERRHGERRIDGSPCGRPRWVQTTTSRHARLSQESVGTDSTSRKSSATTLVPSAAVLIGALKSHRTSTRLPASGGRSSRTGSVLTPLR